jgi:predicted ribonuclease YlaK
VGVYKLVQNLQQDEVSDLLDSDKILERVDEMKKKAQKRTNLSLLQQQAIKTQVDARVATMSSAFKALYKEIATLAQKIVTSSAGIFEIRPNQLFEAALILHQTADLVYVTQSAGWGKTMVNFLVATYL